MARDAQRVLGTSHPTTTGIERHLKLSREALIHRARDLKNARGKAECAEKVLRFPVGTRVECNVRRGGWRKGRVVKHWYWEPGMPPGHFMPYQIELDSGCLIFARHDDDRSIRRAID